MAPVLLSVRVGRPRRVGEESGQAWVTAFFKSPVAGAVALELENLAGDEQADLSVHGGPDKAVCVYPAEHLDAWRRELDEPRSEPGAFGENFTLRGQTEETACIGDVYRVGTAVVQVSQPRGPCWKLARRWARPELLRSVLSSGRTGWYLRVLERGEVAAGQPLELIERPYPEVSVARVNRAAYARPEERAENEARRIAGCTALAVGWREALSG